MLQLVCRVKHVPAEGGGTEGELQRIREAYAVLNDKDKRAVLIPNHSQPATAGRIDEMCLDGHTDPSSQINQILPRETPESE